MKNLSFNNVFGGVIHTPMYRWWGFILLFFVFSFFAADFAYAGYQKIAPGDIVTLGEFVFDDNFVATTTPCTIGITDPLDVVKVPSTTPMTASTTGWHYYDYTTAVNAPSGTWPSFMICGSAINGDLVKVDKSFSVESIGKGWTVTLSDFGETTVNTAYKAKLQVLNSATTPTDADSLPTVVITDSAGTIQVPAGVMTKDSAGTYSYSFSIPGTAVGGVWETVVSVVINGKTVRRNDYWSLSSSPADVNIIEITDKIIPTITANVRIDNKGTSGSDFYYVYCIVNSADGLCGNGSIALGSATVFINAGGFTNLSLTLDHVTTAGTYWFKVKARALAETNWAAASKQFVAESGTVIPPVNPPGGGQPVNPPGGGGGGGPVTSSTEVNFSGRAYPKSTVTFLKDAQRTSTTIADANANFSMKLSNLSAGNYIFSVYSEDRQGRRSSLLTFPVGVTAGTVTTIGGIFIAPTIAVDKSEVARGENIAIFGQSVPVGDITIVINSDEEFFGKIKADKDGIYLYNFDTTPLALEQHFTKSKATIAGEVSSFGSAVSFKVGKKTVLATALAKCPVKADLNSDCKVNLIDFSIAAYWYKRTLSVGFKKIEKDKLNGDEKITLVDFSIMAYYWTG